MPKIYLIDVTNRDGVQTARLGLSKLEKTMINIYLSEMGVFQSEFGFPTTRHEINYLNANLELARKGVLKPIVLNGWIRAIKEDVKKATELTDVENLNLSAAQKKKYGEIRETIKTHFTEGMEGRKAFKENLQREINRERPDMNVIAGILKTPLREIPQRMGNTLDLFVEFYAILDEDQKGRVIEKFREKMEKHHG